MSWRIRSELRRLLDGEAAVQAGGPGGGRLVVVAFANTYHLGMSNLGFQAVFGLMADRPGLDPERAFLPEPEFLEEHRRTNTPWLTLESQRPVREAEVVAFSLPFENDYLGLLTLLDLAGLPLLAQERGPEHPLIVAGGVAATLNPEPLAPFVDLILAGEAEACLPAFLSAVAEGRTRDRPGLLLDLARSLPGAYAPGFYRELRDGQGRFQGHEPLFPDLPQRIKRTFLSKLETPVISRLVSAETEFDRRLLIELSRGCGRGCRFCAAGHVLLPPRPAPLARLLEAVRLGAERFGQVGLISAAVSDLPGIEELVQAAADLGAKVSVSSLRADTLSPALAQALAQAGVRTLTIAPEAGSERLRKVINKGLTEATILEAATIALEAGIPNLKLYFMVGLPTETDQDVLETIGLVRRLRDHLRSALPGRRKPGQLGLSVNAFVPKPVTPFQWAAMAPQARIQELTKKLKKAVKGERDLKLTLDSPKWAAVEALISRGDRRVGELLLKVFQAGGDWTGVLRQTGFPVADYVLRERSEDEPFPWEIIDHGPKREFLWAEYRRAVSGRLSPPCRPDCRRCGVCGGLEEPTPSPPSAGERAG